MALDVWSGVAQVVASLPGPGRIDLFAVRRAGRPTPVLFVEAYDGHALVARGEVAVWELNQAIAALLSATTQARQLTMRDSGGHGGRLDVVADDGRVDVVATSADGRRQVAFATRAEVFAGDLNALVRHYLTLTRADTARRTIVLPDRERAPGGAQLSARAALTRPAPK